MSIVIYMDGLLEPVVLQESFFATVQNMNAAMNNKMIFFQGNDKAGHPVVVSIPRITHMVEVED